jgi:hypothetical protein
MGHLCFGETGLSASYLKLKLRQPLAAFKCGRQSFLALERFGIGGSNYRHARPPQI